MGRVGSQRSYSANPNDYQLLEEIGSGATATVNRAIYLPFNEVLAVKRLDLDRMNSKLDDVSREAHIMSLIDHPNLVKAHCSFSVNQYLWVIMPFMAEGSCLHLMKIAYPDGLEEPAICSILYETLKALEYLHYHGHIHRDIKAGNILLHSDGTIKLGDFGVSAYMFDSGDRKHSRNTFVGTPCWMAPEVLQPDCGYDFKADIWSFGITALELAHGHAPFSKYPPMKVLLMTIQNAPPGLDYERDKKFSRSFKEMVAMCLVKDPKKRPTAEKLLRHSFFKHAKPPELTVKKLVADLPPLWESVKALQLKEASQLALKKMPSSQQEAISQSEYKRGVSAWNFNIEDLKEQASLVQDNDRLLEVREGDEIEELVNGNKDIFYWTSTLEKSMFAHEGVVRTEDEIPPAMDKFDHVRKVPSYSGPLMLPAQVSANSMSTPIKSSAGFTDSLEDKSKGNHVQIKGRFSVTSGNIDIVKGSPLQKSASVGDWTGDQRQTTSKVSIWASLLLPHLQSLLQQTTIQQDAITDLLHNLQKVEKVDASENGRGPTNLVPHSSENANVETVASERRMLLLRISELQTRMISLTEELNAEKLRYIEEEADI